MTDFVPEAMKMIAARVALFSGILVLVLLMFILAERYARSRVPVLEVETARHLCDHDATQIAGNNAKWQAELYIECLRDYGLRRETEVWPFPLRIDHVDPLEYRLFQGAQGGK